MKKCSGSDNAKWVGTDPARAAGPARNHQGEREEDQAEQNPPLPRLKHHWGPGNQPRGRGRNWRYNIKDQH